jgi:hypothetical protein
MRKTRKSYRDVLVATLASLLANAGVAWLLLSPPRAPDVPDEIVLVVDFEPVLRHVVARRSPEPAEVTRRPGPRAQQTSSRHSLTTRPEHVEAASQSASAESIAGAAPVSAATTAVFLQQARDWGERQAVKVPGDPFAKSTPPLPGGGAQRFRLREPPSPARLVARIGIIFGADGVTGCTKIQDRVAGYANSGDRVALQAALEYERRLCRP